MLKAAVAAFQTIIFPGLLFTAVVGLYLAWVDRKVTARIQSRMGPPWWQSFADVVKLLQKKMILPRGSRRAGFLLAPLLGLAGATLAATIVWTANLWPSIPFVGDLIVVIYLLAVPSLALILGGATSRSPFGAIGAGREMQMVLAYELPFLLAVAAVVLKAKAGMDAAFEAAQAAGVEAARMSPLMLADFVRWQAADGVLALSFSGALALLVGFFAMQAKLGFLPFDQPEAETEIIGGPLAEYSGAGLALFKITNAMMLVVVPVFLATIFLGGIGDGNLMGILLFVLKVLVIFVLIVVVKSTHARLRIDQVLKLYWGRLSLIAAIAVVLALVGW